MTMWKILFWTAAALGAASLVFLAARVPGLTGLRPRSRLGRFCAFSAGLACVAGATAALGLALGKVNAFVCLLHAAAIWAAFDLASWLFSKLSGARISPRASGLAALTATLAVLSCGWYLEHNVWQTRYELATHKSVPALRVAIIADVHLGTTFNARGFARHLSRIEAASPDLLAVVGDYVDDDTTREDMLEATRALGRVKTTHGVFFVSGNHDRGYYGPTYRGFSEAELFQALEAAGVRVLQDEAVALGQAFYLVGRRDRSASRVPAAELLAGLERARYAIVLDHQPADFDSEAAAGADLVLCGHTHGGQLFPFNRAGRWIGANDLVYGHERRGATDFVVTSGISNWALKFKTGTKSEFVIVDVKPARGGP